MSDTAPPPDPSTWNMRRRTIWLIFAGLLLSAGAQAAGAREGIPVAAAFVPFGFAFFAVLGLLGDVRMPARSLALLVLVSLVAATALGSLALVVIHVVEPGALANPGGDVEFAAGGESRLTFLMALLALSTAAVSVTLFHGVRVALRDIIPLDPARFSHAMALAAAVCVTLLPLMPLLVLGKPPLPLPAGALPPGSPDVLTPSFAQRAFEMGWFAVVTLLAAGPGSGRRGAELRARLALSRPTPVALLAAVAAGAALAFAVSVLNPFIQAGQAGASDGAFAPSWMPAALPWAPLLASSAFTAVGTELTFRGYLQPRLGIVLANLVLVAPLAWVTPLQGLGAFFGVGLVFGAVRHLTGTIPAIAAHLTFLLVVNGL